MGKTDNAIKREVVRLISKIKRVRPARLQAKANLSKDIGFDPVDVVDIILALEKNFQITIPDEVPINTVGDFIDYVAAHGMRKAS